ncbi:hypothetical protein Agub_g13520, partial [Astrephomene gubernaculifera]
MGAGCSTSRSVQVAPAPDEKDDASGNIKVIPGPDQLLANNKLPKLENWVPEPISAPPSPIPAGRKQKLVLDDAPQVSWPPHLATVTKGISLRGLRKVREALRKHFGEKRYPSVTTADVCSKWVKPITAAAGKCRLVEVPGLLTHAGGGSGAGGAGAGGGGAGGEGEDVGVPQYFISHAWSNSIELLFRKVFDFLSSADECTRVWLDVLAVCQHEDMPPHRHDIAAFADVVAACSGGTLVVMDLTRCNPSTRAWCIFEWAHTLAAHGPDGLHMQLAPLERAAVFRDLDVERAECFRAADKEMIMREVRRQHGSSAAFNSKLKLQLLLEPLSYRVDLRRLQQRSRDTEWQWGPVEEWMQGGGVAGGGGGGGSRALCVVSGAGEGKSTISAELIRRLTPPPPPPPSTSSPASGEDAAATPNPANPNTASTSTPTTISSPTSAASASTAAASASGGVVSAYHFLKYNDQRRLEPVRIVKSLAFQLASRLPSVCACLLECDVAAVAQMTEVGRAFEELLLRPMMAAEAAGEEGGQQVLIILDALDEADPAPSLSSSTSSSSSSPSSPASPASSQPRYPVLCGNRALQLLAHHLQRLPPRRVRFFLTTRPDAAGGRVVACLDRTFREQGGAVYLRPSQLVRGGGGGGGGEGGGGNGGGGGGGGVLVYLTVMKACLGEGEEEEKEEGEEGKADGAAATEGPAAGEGGGGHTAPAAAAGGGGATETAPPAAAPTIAATAAAAFTAASAATPPTTPRARPSSPARATTNGTAHASPFSPVRGTTRLLALVTGGYPSLRKILNTAAAAAAFASASGNYPSQPQPHAPDLAALHEVYGKVFRRAYDTYSSSERSAVCRLLEVLLAAQEPLPQSLVAALGLGGAVGLLPGWGVLFYVDEHHLFTLHKSLADWLLLDAATGSGSAAAAAAASSSSAAPAAAQGVGGGAATHAPAGGAGLQYTHDQRPSTPSGGGGRSIFSRFHGGGTGGGGGGAGREVVRAAEAAAAANPAQPRSCFSLDLCKGHLMLGRYLASTRLSSPSPYCLKYLVAHLASAGPPASPLLDDVLAGFAFVQAAFAAGFGAHIIRALGFMSHATRLSRDVLRWLRAKQHDIAASPTLETVVGTALMSPTRTELYKAALNASRQSGGGWMTRGSVPPYEVWPADLAVLKGHAGGVTAVLFSPDGRQLVSSSGGGCELRVWDISTGSCGAVLQGHTADVTCLAMSPDGTLIASGSSDMTCRLWDAATGQCTGLLLGHTGGVTGLSFSPPLRGAPPLRLVTSSSDNTLRIWVG